MSKQSSKRKQSKPVPPKEPQSSKSSQSSKFSQSSSDDEPEMEIRQHRTFRDSAKENEVEKITIYCRTRKTVKKAVGGTTTMLATGGSLALCGITGGLAAPWVAAGTIGVAGTSYVSGTLVTGLLVN